MASTTYSNEKINAHQLTGVERRLTEDEFSQLWYLFKLIEVAWQFEPIADRLRSQWEDMMLARCRDIERIEPNTKAPKLISYAAEYVNAANVIAELRNELNETDLIEIIFFSNAEVILTRLDHMKAFVVDDFIKLYVLSGGFKQFGNGKLKDSNYRAFMKGSRYAETPPVRISK